MPDFGHPFSGLAKERKISDQELIRSIRFMIAAEYEAIQLYMQLAESTDNKLAIEVLKDIADEERVHAGEFLRLLKELDPDEEKFYAEGAEEVEEEIEKLTKWQSLKICETRHPTLICRVPCSFSFLFIYIHRQARLEFHSEFVLVYCDFFN